MTPDEKNELPHDAPAEKTPFPIVAIGAAAGGADAMTTLLKHLSPTTGAAYIYIQHQETGLEEDLPALFSTHTQMAVQEATADRPLVPNHLYVLPLEASLTYANGVFNAEPHIPADAPLPINRFFSALADEANERAVGVLLSGRVIDGVQGLKAIKLAGGLTFAQDQTARFQTLPKSAMAEGAVDLLLPPERLAAELSRISSQLPLFTTAIATLDENLFSASDDTLYGILKLLRRTVGVDFEQYKMNTIKRRIVRRMMLYKINTPQDYLTYLGQNASEINFLYQDLLINVASFFRDEETTEYLKRHILPKIIESKGANEAIRVWVPACSTGQEAYSMAMLILEALGENTTNLTVQVFATDLSEAAVNKARAGQYTREEVASVSSRRLQRFFSKPDGYYRISKSVRDVCVFATHNIAKDPPFTRLDLISCCNLLIYLDTPLQQKIIATFHYAMNNTGYLVLGKSETVGSATYLFSLIDKKVKVYSRKRDASAKAMFDLPYRSIDAGSRLRSDSQLGNGSKAKSADADLEEAVDKLLIKRYTPASVLVNYDLDILLFRGSTGLYLEPSPGKASLNLMKMAKSGLSFELRNIVHKAKKTGQPARKTGLEVATSNKPQRVSIEAMPMKVGTDDEYYLVVFEDVKPLPDDTNLGSVKDQRVKQLEGELTALREDMRSIVEAQEAANEELQSANEEIVSSNEELQSINEELETSKEEIESSNEELITINQELQIRNEQLAEMQEYSSAIFNTISESVLVLDRNLQVKSANKSFYQVFAVREEETEARMIYELGNRQWDIPKLREMLERVVTADQELKGFEVSHNFVGIGEKTMKLNARRITHVLTRQDAILLTIQDITEFKQAQQIITDREAWFRSMADNAPVMIWVTDTSGLCTFTNKLFLQFRGITLNEALQKSWTVGAHPDDKAAITNIYEASFAVQQPFELSYRLLHADGNYRKVFTKAKANVNLEGAFMGYIGSCVELDETVKQAARS